MTTVINVAKTVITAETLNAVIQDGSNRVFMDGQNKIYRAAVTSPWLNVTKNSSTVVNITKS